MGQQIIGNRRSLRAQLPDGTVEIDRVPMNNGGGDEAQARRAEALVFEGAVSNFPLAPFGIKTHPIAGNLAPGLPELGIRR